MSILCKSHFVEVDKVFRLRSRIETRIKKLNNYFIYELGSDRSFKEDLESEIRVLDGLRIRLAYNSIIESTYREVYSAFKSFPLRFETHCRKVFGEFSVRRYDPRVKLRLLESQLGASRRLGKVDKVLEKSVEVERRRLDQISGLFKEFSGMAFEGRKKELLRRCQIEIEEKSRLGWFFVFNTLTVDEVNYRKVFYEKLENGLTSWQEYIRLADKVFGISAYGDYRKALRARRSGEEYHNYLCVVEKGDLRGRLHMHVFHSFKVLPESFVDPNIGLSVPYRMEIQAMKLFWRFGSSQPKAVRLSEFDAFGSEGWIWPHPKNKETGVFEKFVAKGSQAIGNYIIGYMQEGRKEGQEVGCIWRTRISRRMGKDPLQKVVLSLSVKERVSLVKSKLSQLFVKEVKVPAALLRRLLLRSLPRGILGDLITEVMSVIRKPFLRRLLDMINGKLVFSRQNYGGVEVRRDLVNAFSRFRYEYNFALGLSGAGYAL